MILGFFLKNKPDIDATKEHCFFSSGLMLNVIAKYFLKKKKITLWFWQNIFKSLIMITTLHAYGAIVRTRGGRLLFGPCHIKELQLVLAFNLVVETFAGFKCPVFAHTHVVWYPRCKCLLLYSHMRVVIKCDLNLNHCFITDDTKVIFQIRVLKPGASNYMTSPQ